MILMCGPGLNWIDRLSSWRMVRGDVVVVLVGREGKDSAGSLFVSMMSELDIEAKTRHLQATCYRSAVSFPNHYPR